MTPVAIGTSVRCFFAIISEPVEGSTCLDFLLSSASSPSRGSLVLAVCASSKEPIAFSAPLLSSLSSSFFISFTRLLLPFLSMRGTPSL